ncbi:hypothetical protein D9M70_586300 [compost metagenome]
MLPAELQVVAVLVVQRRHGLDAERRAVARAEEILAQIEFGVLLALVAEAVLGRHAGELETALGIAAFRLAGTAAQVTAELHGLASQRQPRAQQGQGEVSCRRHYCSACSCSRSGALPRRWRPAVGQERAASRRSTRDSYGRR